MNKKLDISTWNRKEIFEFFSSFEEPYFGITASLDMTKAYDMAKSANHSIFLIYLYASLRAVQTICPLKLRIEGAEIVEYETIHASATINRPNGTFGFSFIQYDNIFSHFTINAKSEIDRIQNTTNLFPERNGNDCIHFSSLPWVDFTSLSHARKYNAKDSVPKISFGKIINQGAKKMMPCSIHVHHGLADGKDVGAFFELFQDELNKVTF
jgi:chloramphenicol O-acetyltransferase type A